MLAYPSIPGYKQCIIGQPCIAFYKYDGSNLRWEWTPKKGFYKNGTRTHLFDASSVPWNQAIEIFQDTMARDIVEVVKQHERKKVERIVAFTEFFGPSSFAGWHIDSEPKQLRLFDVSIYKRGFYPARQFHELFGHLPYSAEVIYTGPMNYEFINAVRVGRYPVAEGVVCKGDDWQCKVKTEAWRERVKAKYGDDWQKYE